MNTIDRWIIGGLVMAISGILWFLLLDMKAEVRSLLQTVNINSNRITILESRLDTLAENYADLKKELQAHRYASERECQ